MNNQIACGYAAVTPVKANVCLTFIKREVWEHLIKEASNFEIYNCDRDSDEPDYIPYLDYIEKQYKLSTGDFENSEELLQLTNEGISKKSALLFLNNCREHQRLLVREYAWEGPDEMSKETVVNLKLLIFYLERVRQNIRCVTGIGSQVCEYEMHKKLARLTMDLADEKLKLLDEE